MTPATTKTRIETKWPQSKIQEETARVFAVNKFAAMSVLQKQGQQAMNDYFNLLHKYELEHYRSLGIKNPFDLVKAKAEFEANVFGSKIEIWGDERTAHLTYNQCGVWNAMQKFGKMTPDQEEKMGQFFQVCVEGIAKELGFKGEVKFEEPCATITFSK